MRAAHSLPAALAAVLVTVGPSLAVDLCGDINDSGTINATDALQILRRGVGQDITFICDPPGVPVQTGQTLAFGAGSDGDLRNGSPRYFVDNGDQTITDFSTGLMWEKKNDSGNVHDKDNNYSWSLLSGNLDGSVFSAFLFILNSGAGFAGHTDWRLPNRFELETLQNLGNSLSPTTHFAFNQNCTVGCSQNSCSCTRGERYWSSTTVASLTSSAWAVGFATPDVAATPKPTLLPARAVRTAEELPTAPTCKLPDPPQCMFNDPCTNGACSLTRAACSVQADCPAAPDEQCCCGGICI